MLLNSPDPEDQLQGVQILWEHIKTDQLDEIERFFELGVVSPLVRLLSGHTCENLVTAFNLFLIL